MWWFNVLIYVDKRMLDTLCITSGRVGALAKLIMAQRLFATPQNPATTSGAVSPLSAAP